MKVPKYFTMNRKVIFKQRVARHLAIRELAWEYEFGNIVFVNEQTKTVNVCWLQGHHSRNDDVPYDDIVSIGDERCKRRKVGLWEGKMRLLQEIVEEGSDENRVNA